MAAHARPRTTRSPRDKRAERVVLVCALVMAVLGPAVYRGEDPLTQDPRDVPGAIRANPDGPVGLLTSLPDDVITAPSIGLAAPLVPITMSSDRVLTPPSDASTVGRWDVSARPGKRKGQTVITGHTLSAGTGAMNTLGDLVPGARVWVREDGRDQRYEVSAVEVLTRAEVADRAQQLFGQDRGSGRLVLVSCTDYVNGEFTSNVIVFADRVTEA